MRLLFLLVLLVLPTSAWAQATFVVYNARVYTADVQQPTAQAIAVQGNRFLMVGTDEAVLAAYPEAPRRDAGGRTLIPGLIDAHAHLMNLGTSKLAADLVGATSKAEVLERLRAFEATLTPDAWLTGRGWDQNDWPEKAFPTRADLDAAFPERPVYLVRIDGHAAWANTAALRAAGHDRIRQAADPEGGHITRDAQGEPTGILIDAAMGFVGSAIPPLSSADRDRALSLALQETTRMGLTGVHDAGVDTTTVRLYQRRIDAGTFPLRLYGMIGGRGATFDHFCASGPVIDYGDRLTVRSVKFYMDGALGSRGAALLEPYADEAANSGLLFQQPQSFTSDVARALECGFQINTHAIGDRANRVALDAYEHAMLQTGRTLGRHRIEHAQVLALGDIPRFAALGVIASVQPTHATSDMYWAEDRVGPERVEGAYAWRSLLDAGARLALGSDFPVEQVNPLLGFYAAVTRQDADGFPPGGWQPEQRLSREEALRGFTLDAAYAAFMEAQVGSITPGKYADFVLLSRDIMTVAPLEILETEVVATYLGGEAVYEQP